MEKEQFFNELKKEAKDINIELNDIQCEKFFMYMNLLQEWNQKMNLTAITEHKDIITKHFIDSLTIYKYMQDNLNMIDVGTGAGFPGIPLKILNENIDITLLDAINKRLNFLNDVLSKLKLLNIKTIHGRAEEAGKNKQYREKFDIATSRAVASLNVLVEYMLPLVKIGGKCICMKGSNASREIENAKNAIKILGGEIEKIEEFYIPNTDIGRTIIVIKKISNTPSQYPRKAGTPAKEPIE